MTRLLIVDAQSVKNTDSADWSYQDLVDRGSIRPATKGGDHVQNQGPQQDKASI